MKEHEKKAEAKKGKALKEKASEGKTSEGKTSKRKQGQALASQQNIEQAEKTSWHHEDLAMKTAAQYFGGNFFRCWESGARWKILHPPKLLNWRPDSFTKILIMQ